MNKTLVVYKSKYGATKHYAKLFVQQVAAELRENRDLTAQELSEYDTVLFFSAIYASGISGLSTLRKNMAVLRDKRVAIFCVGASPYDEKTFLEMKRRNLKDDLCDLPVFYGRGAWNEAAMSLTDRTLCRLLQKSLTKKEPGDLAPWEQALLEAQGRCCDWTDATYLQPLLDWLAAVCD